MKDIEQRASDKAYQISKAHNCVNTYGVPIIHVLDAMKEYGEFARREERERGKRFANWLFNNMELVDALDSHQSGDHLFNLFLEEEEEKELNN